LITFFRYLLFLMSTLFIGLQGSATSSEGVYIEEKGTVVFFSDAYQIINLKSEDNIVFYPSKVVAKKEVKLIKNVSPTIQILHSKRNDKKVDIKIPIKHLLFNVKNAKKRENTILKSCATHIVLFGSIVLNPFLSANGITSLGVELLYMLQNKWSKSVLMRIFNDFDYIYISYILLGLFLNIFFYTKTCKNAKNSVYSLKRGPPYPFIFENKK